jgi:hypothetical protein
MKKGQTAMLISLTLLVAALLGLMAFVRLAPDDTARWNTSPVAIAEGADEGTVLPLTGGGALWLGPDRGDPQTLLADLDAVALATPRTTRLAGSVAEGRITWKTRSALWGFPDYTTAEARPEGLYVHARLRFGREDMGVNATRLADWLSRL